MEAQREQLPGEAALAAAIIRQALVDVQSGNANIRAEAVRFLSDPRKVEFWDNFLALDGVLVRHAQALVEGREP